MTTAFKFSQLPLFGVLYLNIANSNMTFKINVIAVHKKQQNSYNLERIWIKNDKILCKPASSSDSRAVK